MTRTLALALLDEGSPHDLDLLEALGDGVLGVVVGINQLVSGLVDGVDTSLVSLKLSLEVLVLLQLPLQVGRVLEGQGKFCISKSLVLNFQHSNTFTIAI